MKKKSVKASAVAENETTVKETNTEEASPVARVSKLDEEVTTSDQVSDPVINPTQKTNGKLLRGVNQHFLDLFWKLADNDAGKRLSASLEVIKHVINSHSTESQLNYTIGRLVQGLASTRECARHGYYITLVGILKSMSVQQLPNKFLLDTIKNRLEVEGTKKERVDVCVGQVLAFGSLIKSGRLSESEEMTFVLKQLIRGSKLKAYILPIAFGFLEELCQQVDKVVFKETVWPLLAPELSLPWDQQTFDTLNLLLVTQEKFPKVVKSKFWKEHLGSTSISDTECFSKLTKLILRNACYVDHPILLRIASSLNESDKLLEFLTNHFEPALETPVKSKSMMALSLLVNAIKVVDSEMVGQLLTKNIADILIDGIRFKEELNIPAAEKALESIKAVMAKEDVTPEAQKSILERLLIAPEHVAFDKSTNTRFLASVTPSLKKETIQSIAEMYHKFVDESSRTQDKIAVIQHLMKLISHPAMNREVEWKASQLVFLAKWAYFSPTASKIFIPAAKETFHKALDHPCRKLEELSTVLSKAFDQVNKLVPDSDISDQVKSSWNSLVKNVQLIQKKSRSTKEGSDSWTNQVFLVLYLNMGFELLHDPTLASEIISELDMCYSKATEKANKRSKSKETDDPHWLEVVIDILLSLLSRNQHLLRSIVVSVWSLLAEHITPNALHQVLDVIDPSKKETPLVDADEDMNSSESELSDEEDSNEGAAADEESDADEEDDGEEDENSDDMDEEETITDKLRMKIHEALGDSAALTDTESIDIDDLSDGQMENLDKALGSAFQEFRKARPVRKNANKLPKDQTALMHFRLRCLDLIEVLTDKELSISLSSAALIPLLSLLEVTVKEPLQKPLMDRTKSVLRKLTNIRRFSDSNDVKMDDLVKLLQVLFSKPYAKKALMPYISEDLVMCCSFVLRCTLHLTRVKNLANANTKKKTPQVEVDGVYQIYRSNLSKYFMKRDSPVPFGVFSRALVYPWPDAGFLLEPLIEYAFGATILKNRKLQAVQLLTALFRNSTALSALGQSLLTKQLHSLLQSSQRVVEEAHTDSKPKYLNELFILLRVVLHCPDLAQLKGTTPSGDDAQLWEPFKTSLAAFTAKGLVKQKDVKKSHMTLARLLGLSLDETVATAASASAVTTGSSKQKTKSAVVVTGSTDGTETTKETSIVTTKKKSKRPGDKEKKEAKQRRMAASAQGFGQVTFAQVDVDAVVDVDATADAEAVADSKEPIRKATKRHKDMKGTDTNGNQLEPLVEKDESPKTVDKKKKKKKMKETLNGQPDDRTAQPLRPVDDIVDETTKSPTSSKRSKKRLNNKTVAEVEKEQVGNSSRENEISPVTPSPAKKKKTTRKTTTP